MLPSSPHCLAEERRRLLFTQEADRLTCRTRRRLKSLRSNNSDTLAGIHRALAMGPASAQPLGKMSNLNPHHRECGTTISILQRIRAWLREVKNLNQSRPGGWGWDADAGISFRDRAELCSGQELGLLPRGRLGKGRTILWGWPKRSFGLCRNILRNGKPERTFWPTPYKPGALGTSPSLRVCFLVLSTGLQS